MKLICTGRGTHPERVLGWLTGEIRDGGRTVAVFTPWVPRRGLETEQRQQQRHGTLRPDPCPTCRRSLPMRQSTATRLLDALDMRGRGHVPADISRLR
ncbi:MAG: hypothetical protein GEV09_14295 [Pseudonocardiaceae bacterium]|nr:hypothetical protein [Pseudonocardiaceae bacterium]